MTAVLIACVLLAGCHPSLPPAPPGSSGSTPVDEQPVHAPYEVVPAELGDANIHARIRHRVRVRKYDAVELERGVPPRGDRSSSGTNSADVLPVLGETPTQIRVVAEDDHARLAVWIRRSDTRRTPIARVEITNSSGAAGAWVDPGAKVEVGAVRGDRHAVTIVDDEALAVDGAVATKLLGHVWVASAEELARPDRGVRKYDAWTPPHDERKHVQLSASERIFAAASTGARIVATTKTSTTAAVIGVLGAFTEVEIWRPGLRVRGFVPSEHVAPAAAEYSLGPHRFGGGHGFAASHADRIAVPPGTCLYASPDGDVIGVQLEKQERYGRLQPYTSTGAPVAPGWRMVYVASDWHVFELFVRDLADDPKQPRLDSCAK